ncbi:MAG: hypothetical protein ACOX2K_07225 [Bacillota bacterium]|jgi:hypothetical protein
MHRYTRKLIAPVIVTILLVAYLITTLQGVAQVGLLRHSPSLLVAILALIGVSVYVLYERIKEIRSGEEDDLGKY